MKLIALSESSLLKDLKNPRFAVGYLEEVLREGSTPAFLLAVRHVAIAQGGMRRLAKAAKCGRESLYKALAEHGNPHFETMVTVLDRLGMRLSVQARESKKRRVA